MSILHSPCQQRPASRLPAPPLAGRRELQQRLAGPPGEGIGVGWNVTPGEQGETRGRVMRGRMGPGSALRAVRGDVETPHPGQRPATAWVKAQERQDVVERRPCGAQDSHKSNESQIIWPVDLCQR